MYVDFLKPFKTEKVYFILKAFGIAAGGSAVFLIIILFMYLSAHLESECSTESSYNEYRLCVEKKNDG